MTTIYVPIITPFSLGGLLNEADHSPIKSHHVAYEIASLSRKLDKLMNEYEMQVQRVMHLQAHLSEKAGDNKTMAQKLKSAEKDLLASRLPHEIKTIKARIKNLNADLLL